MLREVVQLAVGAMQFRRELAELPALLPQLELADDLAREGPQRLEPGLVEPARLVIDHAERAQRETVGGDQRRTRRRSARAVGRPRAGCRRSARP